MLVNTIANQVLILNPVFPSIKTLILSQEFSIELLYVLLGYFLISMILTPV